MTETPPPVIDVDVVARLRELGAATGEPGFITSLVEDFATTTRQRVTECRQHLAAGDLERIEREAHSLKGSSGTIGAARVRFMAAELEGAARDGDAAATERLVAALVPEVDAAIDALVAHTST